MFFWQVNFIKLAPFFHYTEIFFTCEVDMREVSCLPVKSEDEILTGAPRCNLILTFLSRSIPDTGRGEVLAVRKVVLHFCNTKGDDNMSTGKVTLSLLAYKASTEKSRLLFYIHRNTSSNWQVMSAYNYLQPTEKQDEGKTKPPNLD